MSETDTIVVTVGIVALLLAIALVAGMRTKVTIFEWQTALLYNGGRFKRTLGPGTYRFFAPPSTWLVFDRRPQFLTVPAQEVLSRDALGFKITVMAEFQIEDPAKLVRVFPVASQHDVVNAIYPLIQLPIREAAATYTLDEIIQSRDALPELVRAANVERFEQAGLKLSKVVVRDIMIAKELRDAYAANAIAHKMSAATLERARSEVAAMRALANAARIAHGNPELMQLRAMQAMQSAEGRHTIIFDFAGKATTTMPPVDLGDDTDSP